MPKIEAGTEGNFLIDSVPYQKGHYEIYYKNETVAIVRIDRAASNIDFITEDFPLSAWTNNEDKTFSSFTAFFTYLQSIMYTSSNESGWLESIDFSTKSVFQELNSQTKLLFQIKDILKSISES